MSTNGKKEPRARPRSSRARRGDTSASTSARELRSLPVDELFKLMIRSGIYTEDGVLIPLYCSDESSAARPTD